VGDFAGLRGDPVAIDGVPTLADNQDRDGVTIHAVDYGGVMSSKMETRPTRMPDANLFYTLDSLNFARSVVRDLEHELKAKAKQLTLDDGRDTITEDDMRRAADELFGTVEGEVEGPGVDDV
jgi:hypothetical protein